MAVHHSTDSDSICISKAELEHILALIEHIDTCLEYLLRRQAELQARDLAKPTEIDFASQRFLADQRRRS